LTNFIVTLNPFALK